MQVAIALMCPGVPVTACAIIFPRVSNTPAERSPDSRTMVVNEVRISAAACSLTTAISRFQRISSVIGSSLVVLLTRPPFLTFSADELPEGAGSCYRFGRSQATKERPANSAERTGRTRWVTAAGDGGSGGGMNIDLAEAESDHLFGL